MSHKNNYFKITILSFIAPFCRDTPFKQQYFINISVIHKYKRKKAHSMLQNNERLCGTGAGQRFSDKKAGRKYFEWKSIPSHPETYKKGPVQRCVAREPVVFQNRILLRVCIDGIGVERGLFFSPARC